MCGFQRHCGFLRHDVVEPGQEWGREQGCAGRYPREHRPYVFLAQRCRQKLSTMLRQVQLAFSCCLLTELRHLQSWVVQRCAAKDLTSYQSLPCGHATIAFKSTAPSFPWPTLD